MPGAPCGAARTRTETVQVQQPPPAQKHDNWGPMSTCLGSWKKALMKMVTLPGGVTALPAVWEPETDLSKQC